MAGKQQTVFEGELYQIDPTDPVMLKWAAAAYFAKLGEHPKVLLVHPDVKLVSPPSELEIGHKQYVHHPKVVLMGKWVTTE